MKIAAITDDGENISQHFGRASYYAVMTVESGQVTGREMRPKIGHQHFVNREGHGTHDEPHGQHHGFGAASSDKHAQMVAAIADCQALIAGGMGWGAYEWVKQFGVVPIITDIAGIDQAVQAYLAGTIVDHTERLH